MAWSDSSATYTSAVRLSAFSDRSQPSSIETLQRPPGSRACCFSACSGSSTTQGRTPTRDLTQTPVWPSHLSNEVGTLKRIFRSSIARPTDTPVYASTDTSRCPPQDSGPRWFRYLLPCRTLSFPTTCRFIPALLINRVTTSNPPSTTLNILQQSHLSLISPTGE